VVTGVLEVSVQRTVLDGGGATVGGPANTVLAHFRINVADATAAPEPASLALVGIGACGMFGYAWRRRKQAKVAAA